MRPTTTGKSGWGPSTKAYAGISVSYQGLDEVQRMLSRLDDPNVKKVLQQATDAGGKVMKWAVLDEMPPNAKPGWKGAHSGDLRKSVWVHRAKRSRPGTVITNKRRKAFWWPMVIGGSREHRIRFPNQVKAGVPRSNLKSGTIGGGNIHHPGHGPNPFLQRAFAIGQRGAMAAVEKVVDDYLESL